MTRARFTLGIVCVCVVWLALLVFDLAPALRGVWPYAWPTHPAPLGWLGLTLSVYLGGAVWWARRPTANALLGWAMAGQVALTLASLALTTDPWFKLASVTVSGVATGWHYGSTTITDVVDTLRHWPAFMEQSAHYSTHLSIGPPGAVLIYFVTTQSLNAWPALAAGLAQPLRAALCLNPRLANYTDAQLASAWLGILMPVWSSLTVFPLYQLGRRWFSETAARWSVIWWPLIPGLLLFSPTLNTALPLLTTLTLVIFLEGLARDRVGLCLLAGGILSVTTFISFAVLPIIVLLGCFLGLMAITSPEGVMRAGRPFMRVGMSFGAGLASVWVLAGLTIGLTPFGIAAQSAQTHLGLEYAYWPWLAFHTNDYLMFVGWPLVILFAVAVAQHWARGWVTRPLSFSSALIGATLITFGALIGSGILRGETGRILQFFTPLVLLGAADALETAMFSMRQRWALTLTQGVLVLGIAAVLRVVDTEFNRQAWAAPPSPVSLPASVYLSGAVFDEALRLESFSGQVELTTSSEAQATLVLWLNWQASHTPQRAYTQAILPVNPHGEGVGSALLYQPFEGHFATTCWRPAQGIIQQRLEVPLPATTPGAWWVSLTLLDPEGAHTAEAVLPNGERGQQVGLGPFYLEP